MINDHLGTPKIVTDDAGEVVWKADYQPFGYVDIAVNGIENNLRFAGQYYDEETGLHYNYHRYYDPRTGRYLTPDPIGLAGGINLFAYVQNNPINAVDPLGLDTFTQNRYLGVVNPNGRATRSPISHTFVYTTNPDGSLRHTYSWGNEYDPQSRGLWFRNRPEDRNAAEQAIRSHFVSGDRVGDASLDIYIEIAFEQAVHNPNHPSRHEWQLFNNCKDEASNLVNTAEALRTEANSHFIGF
jgi:RHS repeat-associated protein